MLKEEEERQKQLENIKIKEWEEKFDKEKKIQEQEEIRREQKLRQKELEKIKKQEELENETKNISLKLENFSIDKTTKN